MGLPLKLSHMDVVYVQSTKLQAVNGIGQLFTVSRAAGPDFSPAYCEEVSVLCSWEITGQRCARWR